MKTNVRNVFRNCEIKKPDGKDSNCPVITLKFRLPEQENQENTNKVLMLDLAPVLITSMQLPSVQMPFLTEFNLGDVCRKRILLVAKSRNDPLQWRVSTSLAERCIFNYYFTSFPITLRILTKMKFIKGVWLRDNVDVKSYHLKTTLLHYLSETASNNETNWEKIDDILLIVELFDKLRQYLEMAFMPHFFLS